MTQGVKPVRAVERTLDILDAFLDAGGARSALGVGEVARLTRHPKSTVYRLLLTLTARGYLRRDPMSDKFMLGERLSEGPSHEVDLRAAAQSVLAGLRDTCGETIGLHALAGDERVCIAAAEGVRDLRTSGRVGSRAPLYGGASARAIMAFLPARRWEEIIARTGLAPLTPQTITDPARLRAELQRIRTEGYAVSTGEWDEGVTSLAAPIFGPGDRVVASINISGPSLRFGHEKISLLVGALKAAATVITQRLGGQPIAPAGREGGEAH